MARIRSIKPEFWSDQELTQLPRDVRMLYVALWNFADEHGRLPGDPRLIKSWCFPLDDDVSAAIVDGWLDQLAGIGKVHRYTVGGGRFLYLPNLGDHQRLEPGKKDSRHPAPEDGYPEHQVTGDSTARAEKSAQNPDESALARARYGTGDRGQGAGDAVALRADAQPHESAQTLNVRAQDLARAYYEREPMCKFPAVMGVAKHAIKAEKYTDQQIQDALLRLADAGRSVTTEALRIELEGLPANRRSSTTDERVAGTLALAQKYEEAGE